MSGPFTIEQALVIFGGPFHSSLVSLVGKIPGDSVCRMIRHLSKWDDAGHSKKGWIDSDEFPTTYFAASWAIQFVGCHHFIVSLSPLQYDAPLSQ